MTLGSMWVTVHCDNCRAEFEVELEPSLASAGSWPRNTDRLYDYLAHKDWTWADGKDLCPKCSEAPTKDDIADFKAYHAGEGIHTP